MSGTSNKFTSTIFRWLKQVSADVSAHRIDQAAHHLAFWISQYTNRRTGDAWPSIATLAMQVGIDRRTVQRLIRQLCQHGHLSVQPGGGRGRSNRYRLILKPEETAANAPPFSATETAVDAPPFAPKQRSMGAERAAQGADKQRRVRHPNHLNESVDKNRTTPLNQRPAGAGAGQFKGKEDQRTQEPVRNNGAEHRDVSSATIDPKRDLYRRGKDVLGEDAAPLITKLLTAKGGKISAARSAIELAADTTNPREYIAAAVRKAEQGRADDDEWLDPHKYCRL